MSLHEIAPNHFEVLESVHTAAMCLQAALTGLECGDLVECKNCVGQACEVITQIPDRIGYQDTYVLIHILFMLRAAYSDPQLSGLVGINGNTVEQWAEGLEVPSDGQLCTLAELYEALN